MLDWDLSGVYWVRILYGMSRGFVLRINRSFSCVGCLCSGFILSHLVISLFKLFIRIILNFCIIIKLLKLSSGNIYVSGWLHSMHGMSRGLILRYCGSFSCIGCLCSRFIFGRLINRVFEMLIRDLFNFCIVIKLLKLSCGNIYGCDWRNRMLIMSRRIILRHH